MPTSAKPRVSLTYILFSCFITINITFNLSDFEENYVFTFNKFENNYESKKSLYLFIEYILSKYKYLKNDDKVFALACNDKTINSACTSVGFKKNDDDDSDDDNEFVSTFTELNKNLENQLEIKTVKGGEKKIKKSKKKYKKVKKINKKTSRRYTYRKK